MNKTIVFFPSSLFLHIDRYFLFWNFQISSLNWIIWVTNTNLNCKTFVVVSVFIYSMIFHRTNHVAVECMGSFSTFSKGGAPPVFLTQFRTNILGFMVCNSDQWITDFHSLTICPIKLQTKWYKVFRGTNQIYWNKERQCYVYPSVKHILCTQSLN
jgi:hypothetical protein